MLAERILILTLFLAAVGALITSNQTAFLLCGIAAIPLGVWVLYRMVRKHR
ncbi:hypothetical protein ACETK8_00075 [Brevundimonas staleyi]|uniref:Uncharacterized protein n=1 Tax=Brevundimonas staleyi TaxID=74326 RepID=A0ABW0FRU3_9CAUL